MSDIICTGGLKFNSKKENVQEKLQQREEVRLANLEKKRLQKEEHSAAGEKVGYFTETFNRARKEIEKSLTTSGTLEKDELCGHFDGINAELQKLQQHLADSVMFLRSYDVRVSQEIVKQLQERFQEQQDILLPKKKFAFKAKQKMKPRSPPSEKTEDVVDHYEVTPNLMSCGFKNELGKRLEKSADEIADKDVELCDLMDCKVVLLGCPSTVHLNGLNKCEVITGPVKTSIFIADCSDCTFVVACQQLRVHSTVGSRFYLHVTSNPIIEDCTRVQFAPYNLENDHLDDYFLKTGLNRNVNNWDNVNDFNWLAADKHSPNWSLIPVDERCNSWCI